MKMPGYSISTKSCYKFWSFSLHDGNLRAIFLPHHRSKFLIRGNRPHRCSLSMLDMNTKSVQNKGNWLILLLIQNCVFRAGGKKSSIRSFSLHDGNLCTIFSPHHWSKVLIRGNWPHRCRISKLDKKAKSVQNKENLLISLLIQDYFKTVAFIAGKSEDQVAKVFFIYFSIDNLIANISLS